jgi:Fe/S biogenesis protein NfuA
MMINISETAQEHFVKLLSGQAEGTSIRVFVVNPGTASAECGVSYCPADAVEADDIELKFEHFSAYIDADSKSFLEEAEIDFTTDQWVLN